MHIVNSGKDAAAVPRNIDCLIISYNFVQKMASGERGAWWMEAWRRSSLEACIMATLCMPHLPALQTWSVCLLPGPLQDLAKQFRVGEGAGRQTDLQLHNACAACTRPPASCSAPM